MIENIVLTGIRQELIDDMIERLGYNEVLNLACNYDKVKKNIEFFQTLGIQCVDDLLLNRDYIFLKSVDEIAKKFSKFNVPVIIDLINTDYTVIDEVFM